MTTDGGGWMMIGYAGNINTNKTNTVGGNYLPLFNTYGTLSSTAKTNRTAFSRMDFAQAIEGASDTSQLMARRTECQSCLLYTSPSPRDLSTSRMPSSA